jgi:hypothetical protein
MVFSTWRDIRDTEQKLLNSQMEKAVLLSERISHGIIVLMLVIYHTLPDTFSII